VSSAKQLCDIGKKPLIIATALEHCDNILKSIKSTGLNFKVVTGKDKTDIRTEALNCLSDGQIDGIICTAIMDEGIDVRDINAIILAGGGKSVPMLYQRVGRATRKKEENNYAIIVDFIDSHNFVLNKHSNLRKRIVEQQKGFKII
jgi:superfamily II DNA or RNA helicase